VPRESHHGLGEQQQGPDEDQWRQQQHACEGAAGAPVAHLDAHSCAPGSRIGG
jgi:hypothetical protein